MSAAHTRAGGDFPIFWIGQTLSALGDSFAAVAMPLLVLRLTGSVARMGLVTGTAGVGALAASFVAGTVADRVEPRRLMLATDIARALVYAAVPAAALRGSVPMALVYAMAATGGALDMVFRTAYAAAVPRLVAPDALARANARVHASAAVAYVAGPALAGVVCAHFGPARALAVDALSFAISALSLGFVRFRASPVRATGARPFGEGLRFVLAHPVLRAVTLLAAPLAFAIGCARDLLIFALRHRAHANDRDVGYALAIASIGAVLGALFVPRLQSRVGFGPVWLGSSVAVGTALLLASWTTRYVPLVALGAGYALADAARSIVSLTARQRVAPEALRGRVTALFWSVALSATAAGATIVSAYAARAGVGAALRLVGVICLAVAALGSLTAARTRVLTASDGA